jgi:signal transduction histidine kinase
MDLRGLLILSAGLLNLFFALIIRFRSSRNRANTIFELTVLAICGWIFAMIFFRTSDVQTATIWARLLYFFPVFIPSGFLLFGLHFPNDKADKFHIGIIVSLAAVMAGLSLIPNAVIQSVTSVPGKEKIISFGWAYYSYYIIYIPAMFLASYYVLVKKYKSRDPFLKAQIRYIFIGLLLASQVGMVTNLILPSFGLFETNWMGQFFTFFWVGGATYAIVKRRFMDIRLVVARTIAYTILLVLLGLIYSVGLFVIGALFFDVSAAAKQLWVSTLLALLMAFSFQPLRKVLEKFTESIFFQEQYDPEELLKSISQVLSTTIDISDLEKNVLYLLVKNLHVEFGDILLTEKDNQTKFSEQQFFDSPILVDKLSLVPFLSNSQSLFIFDELEEGELKKSMRELDLGAIVKLITKQGTVGLLILGQRKSGGIYVATDIRLLEILGPQLAIAIQNAKAFEEIRKFNITLQDEVNKATTELRDANEKLKQLDKLKDEFVSLASHELRTPMTAVKSYTWMVLNGKADTPEKQKEYLNIVYVSVERLLHLVNDMLDISRIESGRVQMTPTVFDMNELALQVQNEFTAKASERHIELQLIKSDQPANVNADKNKIQEVVENLVSNAVKFTPENGHITIAVAHQDGLVKTSITDTGKGISAQDMEKLFKKFGRLDNSLTGMSSEPGTGLGLFICKQYTELSGGKIWVESEVGKGATFAFTLPQG